MWGEIRVLLCLRKQSVREGRESSLEGVGVYRPRAPRRAIFDHLTPGKAGVYPQTPRKAGTDRLILWIVCLYLQPPSPPPQSRGHCLT